MNGLERLCRAKTEAEVDRRVSYELGVMVSRHTDSILGRIFYIQIYDAIRTYIQKGGK